MFISVKEMSECVWTSAMALKELPVPGVIITTAAAVVLCLFGEEG